MYTIDNFVEAMAKAMTIAQDIPGIATIHWDLRYQGQTQTVTELVDKMTKMMNEVNGNGSGEVEAA